CTLTDNQTIRPDVSDGKITITGSQSAMLFDELGWSHSKTMP
ncbi:IS66 family insertion sequence element accessory protein TnpB, partial [Salmonella enterica]|nr:IS66 family insertion sequence element accessory protein TnpB [Salmonella enterica]